MHILFYVFLLDISSHILFCIALRRDSLHLLMVKNGNTNWVSARAYNITMIHIYKRKVGTSTRKKKQKTSIAFLDCAFFDNTLKQHGK